jgi:hypothetical protein
LANGRIGVSCSSKNSQYDLVGMPQKHFIGAFDITYDMGIIWL